MSYEKISYNQGQYDQKRKLLMIGCSGGGGHIAAIQGLRGFFEGKYGDGVDLPNYRPVLYEDKQDSATKDQIARGVGIMHLPVVGRAIRAAVSLTAFPELPNANNLHDEITALSNKEKGKERPYIDMLLDVYPAGYESAAIWNVLQRNDKTSELKKLIKLQSLSDKENHQDVLTYYFNALKNAAEANSPYTEIVSTQAMALPGLCDAILTYNKWLEANPQIQAPHVKIHQYMTDLPTKGAVHFFNALATLSFEQQQQMKLYGVGMQEEILQHFFPNGNQFSDIFDIPAEDNPMVRPGFKQGILDNSAKFHEQVTITLSGEEHPFIINAQEQIAAIMLGSQASNDTIEYIETMLENGMDKVFVFGGKMPVIQQKISEIIKKHPEYNDKIIPLGNQGDKEIAPLMSRANLVVIRGGGLSVMEQLAMNHSEEQSVLIHHANSTEKELTSGISWEDDNVKYLITDLQRRNVYTAKTSPEQALRQIPEARLVAAAKRFGVPLDIEDITKYIKQLSHKQLKLFVAQLKESDNQADNVLPKDLKDYFDACNQLAQDKIDLLNVKLNQGLEYLSGVIRGKLPVLEKENSGVILKDDDIMAFQDEPLVRSFLAAKKLQATISPDLVLSPNKKLTNFKLEFEFPETKQDLMNSNDSIFTRIIREIEYQLAKIFPSLAGNFTFFQDIRKHMSDLQAKEDKDLNDGHIL